MERPSMLPAEIPKTTLLVSFASVLPTIVKAELTAIGYKNAGIILKTNPMK